MANSVTNDALWEKLSEISERLKPGKQSGNTTDFNGVKDELFAEMEKQIIQLVRHGNSNFKAINERIAVLDRNTDKVLEAVERMEKQQVVGIEPQVMNIEGYVNFKFFKVMKSSMIIALGGLLVFVLIFFCVKQQDDYVFLMNEFHRNRIELKVLKVEVDSLRNLPKPGVQKKKR